MVLCGSVNIIPPLYGTRLQGRWLNAYHELRLNRFLKFTSTHNGLQEVSESACFQSFTKRINITHSQSHGVDFGINVLHSGELVAPGGGKTSYYVYSLEYN